MDDVILMPVGVYFGLFTGHFRPCRAACQELLSAKVAEISTSSDHLPMTVGILPKGIVMEPKENRETTGVIQGLLPEPQNNIRHRHYRQ